eukprot:GEMP01042321.1.p1 GENE.GEMP01042321.1~~GEMP01042321.1.p1  ORF type:complete len:183 (+),score=20.48 GEMP01042321.1:195-743(+)
MASPEEFDHRRCNNCGGIGHLARGCPSPKQCDCCGSFEHFKIDCPNTRKVCDLCNKVGHLKIKCHSAHVPEKGYKGKGGFVRYSYGYGYGGEYQGGYGGAFGKGKGKGKGKGFGDAKGTSDNMTCWNCNKKGHRANGCNLPQECHACGSRQHVAADCPHKESACDLCGRTGHLKNKCNRMEK